MRKGFFGRGRVTKSVVVALGLLASVVAAVPVGPVSAAVVDEYATQVGLDSPLVFYRFEDVADGVISDSSGAGRGGTFVGAVPEAAGSGAFAGSTGIDLGDEERITVPRLSFHGASFTVEAWIKTTSTDDTRFYDGNSALTIFGDSHGEVWTGFGVDGGKLRLTRYSVATSSWQVVNGQTNVNDGEWHHVAATVSAESNVGAIYVDGVLDAQGTLHALSTDFAAIDSVGAGFNDYGVDGFVGSLDEVAVYGTALTAGRVAAHFNAAAVEQALYSSYDAAVDHDAPVARWTFDNTALGVVGDVSGHNHDVSPSGEVVVGAEGVLSGSGNRAVHFGGAGHGELPAIGLAGQSFTVEAWINTTSMDSEASYEGNAAGTILGDDRGSVWFSFGIHDGRVQVSRHSTSSGTWQYVTGLSRVNDGGWHHVAATLDASSGLARIYVDGNLETSGPLVVAGDDRAAITRIGAGYNNLDRFVGLVDDVAVYRTVLTPGQIRDHVIAAGFAVAIPELLPVASPGGGSQSVDDFDWCFEAGGDLYLLSPVDGYTGCVTYDACVGSGLLSVVQEFGCDHEVLLLDILQTVGSISSGISCELVLFAGGAGVNLASRLATGSVSAQCAGAVYRYLDAYRAGDDPLNAVFDVDAIARDAAIGAALAGAGELTVAAWVSTAARRTIPAPAPRGVFAADDLALGLDDAGRLRDFARSNGVNYYNDVIEDLYPGMPFSSLTTAIDDTVAAGGRIHFNLDGIEGVDDILLASSDAGLGYTARELRYVCNTPAVLAATTFHGGSAPC